MQAPTINNLRWIKPRRGDTQSFIATRQRLEAALLAPPTDEIYQVNTRSIYRFDDQVIGALAIKELRFETPIKRWRNTTLRRHRMLCEFHAADCFTGRGGNAPQLFGAALEYRRGFISRVFLFLQWLDSTETLSEAFISRSDATRDGFIQQLARSLVDSANRGLVHGRHSSENVLVDGNNQFYVIDFSHAQIFPRFQPAGFMRDVGRIGARLSLEGAADRALAKQLFDEVSRLASTSEVTSAQIMIEFDNVLQRSKWHQRRVRNWHTFWRGLPRRLCDEAPRSESY